MTLLQQLEDITAQYAEAHRVPVAGFIAMYPNAEVFELFSSSPALGLLLVYAGRLCKCALDPWDEAHRMIFWPRYMILGRLGLPPTRSAVRIVAKINVSRITVDSCLLLRKLFRNDEALQRLRHLPAISGGVIEALASESTRLLTSFSFLEELACRDDDYEIAEDLRESVQLAKHLDIQLKPFHDCESVINAATSLREMEVYLIPDWSPEFDQITFPDPPITVPIHTQPANLSIEPIRTPRDLYEEAVSQVNCIFGSLHEIESGNVAVYRVTKPERGTVMLRRSDNNAWIITECRAAKNKPVRRETLWAVGAYLTRRLDQTAPLAATGK